MDRLIPAGRRRANARRLFFQANGMETRTPPLDGRPKSDPAKAAELADDAKADTEGRPSAAKRGYGRRWRRARKMYLAHHPLCVACAARGRTTLATVVDHIVPARHRPELFWDAANWQAMCHRCHNAKTAADASRYGGAA